MTTSPTDEFLVKAGRFFARGEHIQQCEHAL